MSMKGSPADVLARIICEIEEVLKRRGGYNRPGETVQNINELFDIIESYEEQLADLKSLLALATKVLAREAKP